MRQLSSYQAGTARRNALLVCALRRGRSLGGAALVVAGSFVAVAVATGGLDLGRVTSGGVGAGVRDPRGLPLTPDLEAGHAGWCSYPALSHQTAERPGVVGCTPASQGTPPVVSRPIDPRSDHGGPCTLGPMRIAGIQAAWGRVIVRKPRYSERFPRGALLSCETAWLSLRGSVIVAAILLNARNSEDRAPALPGSPRWDPRSRTYSSYGGTAGDLTAQRFGGGWLVVQGANRTNRLAVLRGLHPRLRSRAGTPPIRNTSDPARGPASSVSQVSEAHGEIAMAVSQTLPNHDGDTFTARRRGCTETTRVCRPRPQA